MPPQAPHGPRQTHTQLKPRVDLRAQPNATVLMKPPRLPGRSRPHPRPVFAALRTEAEGPPRCRALATHLAAEGQWLRAAAALTGARLSDLCPPEGQSAHAPWTTGAGSARRRHRPLRESPGRKRSLRPRGGRREPYL